MPKIETIESFIKAVESEAHNTVIEKFYTEDAEIQENQDAPRIGRANLVENEKKILNRAIVVSSKCSRPFFLTGDFVVIRWFFRFEWKDNTFSEIEEMVHQTWRGEKIFKEQFFYNPKQFVPSKITNFENDKTP